MIRNLAIVATLAFALPSAAQAQSIYVGAGILSGVSDFGDATDPGFLANAGFLVDVGESPISVGVDGMLGSAGGIDDGPSTTIWSVMGLADVTFGQDGSVRPYVFGGAGVLGFDIDTEGTLDGSDSNFGYQAGAGLSFPVSDNVGIWVDGRYVGSEDVKFIAGVAGLGFSLGG